MDFRELTSSPGFTSHYILTSSSQFNFFWSSHSMCLRDITTRDQVPSRLESSLGTSDPNTCVSGSHQQQIDGPSDSKNHEGHNLNVPSAKATSDEMHLMATDWRHTVSSLQSEIRDLTTAISSLSQTPQVPHDGYELIATALREVRAKAIEIEALKQENQSLRLKSKHLENIPLTRIEGTSTLNNHPFAASPNAAGQTVTLDQRDRTLVLNSNGKRPLREEISLATIDRNSKFPDAERSHRNSTGQTLTGNAVSLSPYNSQSIPVVSNKTHHEATNSDTDELAQSWQAPRYQKLSSNVNSSENLPSNANAFPTGPNQRQVLDRSQFSQEIPAKPSKRKAPAKTLGGRPRTKSLPATASTTKIPLKEPDTNRELAINPPTPTDSPDPQTVGESQIKDKPQSKKKARRASARLSRRSYVAPPYRENAQHASNAELNQVHSEEDHTLQQQVVELQENPPHPTPNIETPRKTIPNSQSDSDNAPLDQGNSHPVVNDQAEEPARKASKSQNPHDPAREKRKSQIAARDSLAKLAMQREEALEAAVH
ncbi:hypothetical protein EMCG_06836 [[Emmonsia] crescens]|uniref:Uncharacterized protein n=1 Tax=[Emmonsia] crescens TaxID=73230 RepID=A0A0G2IB26_9EURO|nr:hypothetical protein EMCG_06836 [Emmonsia crescens UAMH 3008]